MKNKFFCILFYFRKYFKCFLKEIISWSGRGEYINVCLYILNFFIVVRIRDDVLLGLLLDIIYDKRGEKCFLG